MHNLDGMPFKCHHHKEKLQFSVAMMQHQNRTAVVARAKGMRSNQAPVLATKNARDLSRWQTDVLIDGRN